MPIDHPQSVSAALAEIAADSAGPEVGAFFDLDGTLVAGFTATALDDHARLTGDIVRPIVWGPTKAAVVQRFCTDNAVALHDSYFYADGDEDAALMALVGHPRPVNPRPRLAAVSAERGWPVLRMAASGGRSRVRSLIGRNA